MESLLIGSYLILKSLKELKELKELSQKELIEFCDNYITEDSDIEKYCKSKNTSIYSE